MPLMRAPDGSVVSIPDADAQRAIDTGYHPVGVESAGASLTQPTSDAGGAIAGAAAGASSALSGATLGLSDAFLAATSTPAEIEALRQARAAHPIVSTGANIAGALAASTITGGESLPAAAASRAGARVATELGGGLAARGIGGAAEGALYGLGSGVSELALDKDPLTMEHAASVLSSNALFGAGVGATAGTLGYGIERGLAKAKGALDSALDRQAAKTQVVTDNARAAHIPTADQIRAAGEEITSTIPASAIKDYGWYEPKGYGDDVVKAAKGRAAIREGQRDPITLLVDDEGKILVDDGRHRLNAAIEQDAPIKVRWARGNGTGPDDVFRGRGLGRPPLVDPATLDAGGLKAARATEIDAIEAAQQPERDAFVDALKDHQVATEAEQSWRYTSKNPSKYVRGLGVESRAADIKVRNLLRNEAALARDPGVALRAIEEQGQALRKIARAAEEEQGAFIDGFRAAPETIRQEILDGKVKGFVVGKGGIAPTSPLIDQEVERLMIQRYGTTNTRAMPTLPAHLEAALNVSTAETRAGDLYRTIKRLTAEPTSERLAAIDAAKEALSLPREASLGERLLGAVPLVGGPLGAIASTANKTLGGLRAVVGKAATRAGEAASSFLGKAAPVAKYAPVLATKVLSQVKYAADGSAPPAHNAEGTTELARLYRARTDEVKSQTAYDAAGVPKLRPEARKAMAARFDGIRPSDPILADRLESAGARRIEYLSSLIPRRPDFGGVSFGPDRWQPSDMEMRSWARSAAAVEDPHGVLERAIHGAVTPEDAAALRAVYPALLEDFTAKVASQLPTLQHTLPYARRLSLSTLTGLPVDPAMHPDILRVLQAQYTYEPEGARAQPQFGSVRANASETGAGMGTASQRREQGAV